MDVKSVTEFHEQAPICATHVLKMGDNYEYANLVSGYFDSCDNATRDGMLNNPMAANNDWFFNIGKGQWQVHLKLSEIR